MSKSRSGYIHLAYITATVVVLCGVSSAPALATVTNNHPHIAKKKKPLATLICQPAAGTVVSATASSPSAVSIPTSWSSSFLAGAGSITRTVSVTSTDGAQVSASFAVDESLLFASADETYGIQFSKSVSSTETYTYTLDVPSGKTAKMQEYHEGDELGITQKIEAEAESHSPECYEVTDTSMTGNYFPISSTADSSYCFAATVDTTASVESFYPCKPVW